MKLNIVTLALGILAVLCLVFYFWGPPWTVARIAGLAIGIPCLLLLALARVQLGRAFSVQAKASTLVTSGLYSRIRNPIYVFWRTGDRRIHAVGQPTLAAADLRCCDSHAGMAQPCGGAGAGGKIRRRVCGVQTADMVLMG